MKKPKILELSGTLNLGGIERAMQEFALNIDKSKFDVIVGAYNISGPRRKVLEAAGLEVIQVSENTLNDIIKEKQIDIVHAHAIRPKINIKRVIVMHEAVFSGDYDDEADVNLIISKSLALKISKLKKLQYGKNFYVLYYPQNSESWKKQELTKSQISTARKKLGLNDHDFVIGRLGRAEPSKTDFLLLASAPVIAKKVKNAKFVFVGLPFLYRKLLSMNKNLKNRLVFLPETPDDKKIAEFYQCIDVFWHTASRGETFGNVNTEAMLFKKPVVTHSTPFKGKKLLETTDNAQIEVVDHEKTGLVADYPGDVAEAMKILQENPKKRKEYGENGYKKILRNYESKIIAKQFEDIAINIMGEKKEKIKITPSESEVKNYFEKEYTERLNKKIDKTSNCKKKKYIMRKFFYKILEFKYLVIRRLLRKIFKYNLEKKY
ncbi:MAG: glycosyltransferase family 4 protein [Candidatus Nanoarchaeia archaeon]